MEHTYEELKGMTVAQLREIAKDIEHEAVRGYSSMHKAQMLHGLCVALGIEEHVHHEVVGVDKGKIKRKIRQLKAERDEAKAAKDRVKHKSILREIHHLKRRLHKATV